MILHVHGEALVRRVGRGALWNCPGEQDAVRLEAKVPMEVSSGVLLHNEEAATAGRDRGACRNDPERFRGVSSGPLLAIWAQTISRT
jgi:hypothetical protein